MHFSLEFGITLCVKIYLGLEFAETLHNFINKRDVE